MTGGMAEKKGGVSAYIESRQTDGGSSNGAAVFVFVSHSLLITIAKPVTTPFEDPCGNRFEICHRTKLKSK
jgi:hypothetical protein